MKKSFSVSMAVSAVKRFYNRVTAYDIPTKAAILTLCCALLNIILCVLCVFAVAIYLIASKNAGKLLSKHNRLGFIFAAFTLIVAAFNLNFFGIIASLFFAAALVIMVSFRDNITIQKLEDAFSLIVGYSVIAFTVAIIQLVFGLSPDNDRSASTFVNPLYYCYYMSFVIVICVYRVIYSGKYRTVYAAVCAVNIFGMLLTGSKMPWIGAVAAIIMMLFLCKKWKVLLAAGGVLVIGIAVFMLLKDHGLREFLHMNGLVDSYQMRIPYWKSALDGIVNKPIFGHGLLGYLDKTVTDTLKYSGFSFDIFNMNETMTSLKHCGWQLHTHNLAFDCLYNFGIAGTFFLLFIVFQKLWYLFRDSGFRTNDPVVAIVAGALVFICVDGIVDCQIIGIQTLFISVFLFSSTGIYKKINEMTI